MNRRMRRALVALLLLISGCGATELAARNLYPDRVNTALLDYLLSPAPAMAGAPFLTDDYRAELRKVPLTCIYGQHVVYHSTYFNYDNCHRLVVGQPTTYNHTVWLFGNSTLQNGEAPDAYTIASQLQALMPDVRVESITSSGQGVQSDLDMMQQEPIQRGDIIIFYTGAIDVVGMVADIQRHHALEPGETVCAALNTLRDITTFRVLCDWQTRYIPESALSQQSLTAYALAMEQRYSDALSEARTYAAERGVTLVNILAPYLWSRPLTEVEQGTQAYVDALSPLAMRQIFVFAWPYLQRHADLDLTHVLDEARDNGAIYFDGWHLGWRGTGVAARAIAAATGR